VASIDADGYMQITDRSKDVIKSGGEWIGSIDLENIAMAHPAVAMAACIAAKHPKWDERPLLVVMKKPGAEVTKEELLAFFDGQDRQVVDARRRGLRRRHPAGRHRQDAEEQAARAVQGLPAADGLTSTSAASACRCSWPTSRATSPASARPEAWAPRWRPS
jgi:acyl-CoA synthetase (AMP-forming)/AMP-acid ligase II